MSQPPFDPRHFTFLSSAARRRRSGDFASTRDIASTAPWRTEEAAPLASLAIADAWSRAAGPALAAVTRVAGWKHGVLEIEVLDRAWEGDLVRLRDTVLDLMNRDLGAMGRGGPAVRALEIRMAPEGERAPRRPPAPGPEARKDAGRTLSPDLDERLSQVAQSYLRARGRLE